MRRFADDDERGLARLARLPRPVEPRIDARADGLDGEARGGAGQRGKALEPQHVVRRGWSRSMVREQLSLPDVAGEA
ncbi:MAG: hypothetical protein V9G20_30115 [Candidatus Promineifilaceae bacterium]